MVLSNYCFLLSLFCQSHILVYFEIQIAFKDLKQYKNHEKIKAFLFTKN